jgi:hypothetical protein
MFAVEQFERRRLRVPIADPTETQCLGSVVNPSGADLARGPETLGVDVDDERHQQDDPSDQDFQEAVYLYVIKAVVEHPEHEQPDDRVAYAAAAPEQAGAADHHRGDRVQQESVELVLLRAAEIGDAQHARHAGADGGNRHHGSDDEADVTWRPKRATANSDVARI